MFKVNKKNIRKRCEICSKLTIKTPERRKWRRSGAFILNFRRKYLLRKTMQDLGSNILILVSMTINSRKNVAPKDI